MARPLSEQKKQSILQAVTCLIAEEGLAATTSSRIAKRAAVSEGTIFTYFENKSDLFNQLYLSLKNQLSNTIDLPSEVTEPRELLWFSWRAFVCWGIENPEKFSALEKLNLSDLITVSTKAKASQEFCEVIDLLEQAMSTGVLQHHSADFAGCLMASMAKTTMDFMKVEHLHAEQICKDGFSAFWKAVT